MLSIPGVVRDRVWYEQPPFYIESTKAADFICMLEEKQEVWFEMMTAGTSSQHPYHCLQTAYSLSRFNSHPLLVSQSNAFARYQAQQNPCSGYSQDVFPDP